MGEANSGMMFPKKKWTEPVSEKPYDGPEAALQKQMDDMLAALGIWSIHIPDKVWNWIAWKATTGIKVWFRGALGGIPDSLCFVPVSDKYMLCAPVELKTRKGKRHGKQKHWESRGISVQISRSPEENIRIVEQLQTDAAEVRKFLHKGPCA